MDAWIGADALPAFAAWARELGLLVAVDGFFESLPTSRSPPARHLHTTTRARWRQEPAPGREAHVFLAREEKALAAAVASGWYPLVVGETLVEKHLADHDAFGEALGYPPCCRAFFRQRNDWNADNTPFAAWAATSGAPRALSNPLPRHGAFGLVPHMACSFACEATMAQASRLLAALAEEAPAYAREVERRLRSPMLSLSELRAFRFDGALVAPERVSYAAVEPLAPTRPDDPLLEALRAGDSLAIDANVLRIRREGRLVATHVARADTHGPEFPFLVECRS